MAHMMDEVTFARDCEGILIPDGHAIPVAAGTRGWVIQMLGGKFTVQLTNGRLVRIAAADADAIGREVQAPAGVEEGGEVTEERVWNQLRTCYDPEIPLDIVELGLVYACHLAEVDGGKAVEIVMTLTAPGCGMGQVLADDVESTVRAIPGVVDVKVELTFDPPWTPDRMSEEGRLELGMFY